ncbi:MAG: saccharopine dehydrogenase NADP-binding domain-containing protein, partial [Pseudomonadota bacterium]
MTKEFDLIVHGATGYTGRIICEYLAGIAHAKDVSWAISGRSEAKLTALAKRLGPQNPPEVIVAHSLQADSMADLVPRTQVIIATVGPYLLFGEELVAACAKAGTDYVDLAGEASWIRSMIDKYGADAASSGARIVHSCGFDSIPTDVGVYKLQSIALDKLGRPFSRVKGRVEELIGEPSGGTIHSILASLKASAKDEKLAALLRNPYALCPGFQGPKQPKAHLPVFDSEFDSWNAAFVMAEINTKTLHRSNSLLSHRYGTDFLYDEMLVTGPGEAGKAAAEKASDFSSMFSPDEIGRA